MKRIMIVTALGLMATPMLGAPVLAADVLTTGTIVWTDCAKGYPVDLRFEKHAKPGRVEAVHDGEGGSVDLNADRTIGADNRAGKEGGKKTITLSGSLTGGTITRGSCSGTYTAK